MSFARQSKGLVACQYVLPNELLPPRSGNCAYALQILRSKASAGCRRVVYGSFSQRCTKLWCDTLLHGATFMLGLWHDGSLMVRRFIALTWLVRFSYSVRKCFVFVIFRDGQDVRGCWREGAIFEKSARTAALEMCSLDQEALLQATAHCVDTSVISKPMNTHAVSPYA